MIHAQVKDLFQLVEISDNIISSRFSAEDKKEITELHKLIEKHNKKTIDTSLNLKACKVLRKSIRRVRSLCDEDKFQKTIEEQKSFMKYVAISTMAFINSAVKAGLSTTEKDLPMFTFLTDDCILFKVNSWANIVIRMDNNIIIGTNKPGMYVEYLEAVKVVKNASDKITDSTGSEIVKKSLLPSHTSSSEGKEASEFKLNILERIIDIDDLPELFKSEKRIEKKLARIIQISKIPDMKRAVVTTLTALSKSKNLDYQTRLLKIINGNTELTNLEWLYDLTIKSYLDNPMHTDRTLNKALDKDPEISEGLQFLKELFQNENEDKDETLKYLYDTFLKSELDVIMRYSTLNILKIFSLESSIPTFLTSSNTNELPIILSDVREIILEQYKETLEREVEATTKETEKKLSEAVSELVDSRREIDTLKLQNKKLQRKIKELESNNNLLQKEIIPLKKKNGEDYKVTYNDLRLQQVDNIDDKDTFYVDATILSQSEALILFCSSDDSTILKQGVNAKCANTLDAESIGMEKLLSYIMTTSKTRVKIYTDCLNLVTSIKNKESTVVTSALQRLKSKGVTVLIQWIPREANKAGILLERGIAK